MVILPRLERKCALHMPRVLSCGTVALLCRSLWRTPPTQRLWTRQGEDLALGWLKGVVVRLFQKSGGPPQKRPRKERSLLGHLLPCLLQNPLCAVLGLFPRTCWGRLHLDGCGPSAMHQFRSEEVQQLLHNKFIVVLGDSIQRCVYKDLVQLLQKDNLLLSSQMKTKGELSFENDCLIEGGELSGLHNGTSFREVRQYRTGHHLVRFCFLTRVYSAYLESILDDFRSGPQPDILVLNSCLWDVSRYGPHSMKEYRTNLEIVFNRMDAVLPASCLVIWNMTMPLGPRVKGGFLPPEMSNASQPLSNDVIEGNFYGATLAGLHLFDVLDLHFHFRFDLGNRVKDGIHWNALVHRRISNLLLTHVADAWGVTVPDSKPQGEVLRLPGKLHFQENKRSREGNSSRARKRRALARARLPYVPPPLRPGVPQVFPDYPEHRGMFYCDRPPFHEDAPFVPSHGGSLEPFADFDRFDSYNDSPFHLDAAAVDRFCRWERDPGAWLDPALWQPYGGSSLDAENIPPWSGRGRRRVQRIKGRIPFEPYWI